MNQGGTQNMYHFGHNPLFDRYLTKNTFWVAQKSLSALTLYLYTIYKSFLFDCKLTNKTNFTVPASLNDEEVKQAMIIQSKFEELGL